MARLVFGMNQSLDGYVDHTGFAPGPTLFRHFIAEAQAQTGSLYGRKIYEIDVGAGWQINPALAGAIKSFEGVVDVRLN